MLWRPNSGTATVARLDAATASVCRRSMNNGSSVSSGTLRRNDPRMLDTGKRGCIRIASAASTGSARLSPLATGCHPVHLPSLRLNPSLHLSRWQRLGHGLLHHLRGSSALAYEADVAIVLNEKHKAVSRDHLAYDTVKAEKYKQFVVFSVEKNRGGPAMVDLEFRKDFLHYRFETRGSYMAERSVDDRLEAR
jgi:hypothetical protein